MAAARAEEALAARPEAGAAPDHRWEVVRDVEVPALAATRGAAAPAAGDPPPVAWAEPPLAAAQVERPAPAPEVEAAGTGLVAAEGPVRAVARRAAGRPAAGLPARQAAARPAWQRRVGKAAP